MAPNNEEEVAPEIGATAPFTERLLRPILSLTAAQQLDLVQSLASGKIAKGDFTKRAKLYQARNEIAAWLHARLPDLGSEWFGVGGAKPPFWKNFQKGGFDLAGV